MGWLAGISLSEGRLAGLSATAGIALGLTINALLAALGLATVIMANPVAEVWLRWAGVAMMLWLAWKAWSPVDITMDAGGARTRRRNFVAGFLVNTLNPKALLFFVAIVPPFLNNREPTLTEATALAMVDVAIATAVHATIVVTAGRAHALVASPGRIRAVRRIMAAMLVGVALWLGASQLH